MRILIIDEEFPYPLNTGKRIRSFHLARALTRRYEVTYLAYGDQDSPGFKYLREQGLSPVAVAPPDRRQAGARFYARLALNLLSSYPYIVTSHYAERFRKRLTEIAAREKFDCILCEWSPYAVFLTGLNGPKKIIVAHNVESSIWQGYRAIEKNAARRLYIGEQARKVAAFEKECFGWADGVIAVSEEDAALIRQYNSRPRVEVIENGVDTDYFKPQDRLVDKDTIVFTGSMDWRPNQDAAFYFAAEIFPILHERRPTLKACFVGRNPGRRVLELARNPGIYVTGAVEDVRPYIAGAGIYIVPLRIGGGSRLKILEAMAMGKAVVSTSLGAQGLRVKEGENIIIRDSPREFAEAVLACLDDDVLTRRISLRGLETIRRYYRWEELGEKLSDYLCETIKNN